MIAHVRGARRPLAGVVRAPGSKNYTTRYLLVSALAEGGSRVLRPAVQDDAEALVRCLRRLGAEVEAFDPSGSPLPFAIAEGARIEGVRVRGFGGAPRLDGPAPLDPGNAGAVARFLMGTCALLDTVKFTTGHADSLGKRPQRDLLEALGRLGVAWTATGPGACLPLELRGGRAAVARALAERRAALGLGSGGFVPVEVSGAVSSQFASSLLFLAPLLDDDIRIEVAGDIKSRPLIRTTREVLAEAGIEVRSAADESWHEVRRGQRYRPREWRANGDWPGSSALLAAAVAVPGSRVAVEGLRRDEQGERHCCAYFGELGARVAEGDPVALDAPAAPHARAIRVDGDRATDAVLAMIAAATAHGGETVFEGIANLQFKECDRVREPIAELRRVYATALPDGEGARPDPEASLRWEPADAPERIAVRGWPAGFEGGIDVDGRGDHRVIMMLSIVALRCRAGLRIRGAEHVSKSFPGWFDSLAALGADITFEEEPAHG
ncbi:MAG: 3-phosphoshikimate 1-carboxyvinyltransferase [Candidatus Sumerlaeia bacterium]|nr:3-phosphoshikimate 1-carboxyvinyltransferase [Candidatus Sumerlaeia bacterium]